MFSQPKTSLFRSEKAVFQNTLWSRVFAAGKSDSAETKRALEELCRLYWYPIYAFLRRRGHDREQARDLAQGFFAYLLGRKLLRKADPERGRFRSFLLGMLKNFASHECAKEKAPRRGGSVEFISLDDETAEERYSCESSSNLTPENLFDRRWAMTVLEEAMRRLKAEYERAQMADLFAAIQPFLSGDGERSFAELGARLNRSEGAARMLVFRLRERFRQVIRAVIGEIGRAHV